jgi:hypothetical protein
VLLDEHALMGFSIVNGPGHGDARTMCRRTCDKDFMNGYRAPTVVNEIPVVIAQATHESEGVCAVTGSVVSSIAAGGVTERPNVPVLKTGVGLPTVGSNPTPSARERRKYIPIRWAITCDSS